MTDQKLRFLARGSACVPDPHGSDRVPQLRRMIGRKHQQLSPGQWAWVPTEAVEECAYHHDLTKACRDGDLWAADEETAKACGVPFDSRFGADDAAPAKTSSKKASFDAAKEMP